MPRGFHSYGTQRRRKYLNPSNVKAVVEGENINIFTLTRAQGPVECQRCRAKRLADSCWLWAVLSVCLHRFLQCSPTLIPSKSIGTYSQHWQTLFKQVSARALKAVTRCKSQRSTVCAKLQIFMQQFRFQTSLFLKAFEYFWFTKCFHLFFSWWKCLHFYNSYQGILCSLLFP